jgi:hypothetical protein
MESIEKEVPEFRRAQGLAYPVAGLICLIVMANAQGVVRGPTDLAIYADTLSPGQLRALKFRRDPHTRRIRCPKKTVFTTLLSKVDDDLLERVLLGWQAQILGPAQDPIVIVDGKKVRHAGVEIVDAVDSKGRFLGSVVTPSKTNEISAARSVLQGQNLVGKTVLVDALHTNDPTARQILFEGGGDYLMTVKGNQPTLHQNLENLFVKQGFSPSTNVQDQGAQTGTQLQPFGDPIFGMSGSDTHSGGLSGSAPGCAPGNPGEAQGCSGQEKEVDPGSCLSG